MSRFRIEKRNRTFEFGSGIFEPEIFGILNLSTDSFSDGSRYLDPSAAVAHARQMFAEGASVIDIGAESTRPGAAALDTGLEISRVVPVVRLLRLEFPDCLISIDTRKSRVAESALQAGADIINDVSGLQFDPDLARVAADYGAGLILMHMRGIPETMQDSANLQYGDLLTEVRDFLDSACQKAFAAGVPQDAVALDPGVGFSKDWVQNLKLIHEAEFFQDSGHPLFYGVSRKSFIGKICGESEPVARDYGTAGVLAYLAMCQVEFVRVHNVRAARDCMRLFLASFTKN